MERAIAHARSLVTALARLRAERRYDLLLRLRSGSGLRVLGGELAHLGKARGFGFHTSGGIVALGCADALEGRHADAIARLQQGLEGYMAANAGYQVPIVLGELARACAGSGRLAEARLTSARPSRPASERASARDEPELWRIKGDILLASSRGDPSRGAVLPGSAGDCEAAGPSMRQLRAAVSSPARGPVGNRQRADDLLPRRRPLSPRASIRRTCGTRERCSTRSSESHDTLGARYPGATWIAGPRGDGR